MGLDTSLRQFSSINCQVRLPVISVDRVELGWQPWWMVVLRGRDEQVHSYRCCPHFDECTIGVYPTTKEISQKIGSAQETQRETRARIGERERNLTVVKLKVTIISTSRSLLGLWEAKRNKSSPSLRVRTFDPSNRCIGTNQRFQFTAAGDTKKLCEPLYVANQLQNTDIILSLSDVNWPREIVDGFKFHRVVLDEAHLLSMPECSAGPQVANSFHAKLRWRVTGTPMVSSMGELLPQKVFLRMHRYPLLGVSNCTEDQETFHRTVNALKNVMVCQAASPTGPAKNETGIENVS
jgi:hypothetical protein